MASTISNKRPGVTRQRVAGVISGTYTAASESNSNNGAVLASGVMTITPGFVPKYVKVVNVTDRVMQEWFEGMNQGDFIETAANGVRTLETDDKLVVNTTTGVVQIVADGTGITDNDLTVWVIEE